jgi:K(+)-stimulated pyrophosphate-energized sodium pump
MNFDITLILGLVFVAALGGLAYAAFNFFSVKKLEEGTERMQEIASAVRVGANAFITYEYKIVAIVAVIVGDEGDRSVFMQFLQFWLLFS